MSCPAPRRASVEGPQGWTSHPWTVAEVKEYRSIGGKFIKGLHDFADRAAAIAAGVSPEKEESTPPVSDAGLRLLDSVDLLNYEERQALLEKLA